MCHSINILVDFDYSEVIIKGSYDFPSLLRSKFQDPDTAVYHGLRIISLQKWLRIDYPVNLVQVVRIVQSVVMGKKLIESFDWYDVR